MRARHARVLHEVRGRHNDRAADNDEDDIAHHPAPVFTVNHVLCDDDDQRDDDERRGDRFEGAREVVDRLDECPITAAAGRCGEGGNVRRQRQ